MNSRYFSVILFSALVLIIPASAIGQTIYIDFGAGATATGLYPSGEATWNGMSEILPNIQFVDLVDSAGTATGMQAVVTKEIERAINSSSTNWNDVTLPWAVNAALSDCFATSFDSQITISGVPAGLYRVELISARNSSGARSGVYTINGAEADAPEGRYVGSNPFNAFVDGHQNKNLMKWTINQPGESGQFVLDTSRFISPLLGDYHPDNRVDAADYVVWRDNVGTNFDLAGNGDETGDSAGIVDQADYDLWAANFNRSLINFAFLNAMKIERIGDANEPELSLSNVVVPEPTSLLLSGLASCVLIAGYRRRPKEASRHVCARGS